MHKKFLSGNLNGRDCRRPTHRWYDNIKMDLREIGWEGVDCLHWAENRDQ
jgi:hypothetical protein